MPFSTEIGNDPKRIVDYFAAIQNGNANRFVNLADHKKFGRTNNCTETDGRLQSEGKSLLSAR